MENSRLMDIVIALYFQAIAYNSSDSYIHKEYDEAIIYIDKDEKIVDTIVKKHRRH